MTVPTTDEMDSTTPEERNALVGYCDIHEEWFKFTRGVHHERCPKCKSKFSTKHGLQLTSQRTFDEKKIRAKKKKTGA
jgi:hypothetical protein